MSRLVLLTLCLNSFSDAANTHCASSGCPVQVEYDDVIADMSNGQEDVDYDEGLEISLLQTSQKLSRQAVSLASEESSTHREHFDRPLAKSVAGIASRIENATGVLGSGNVSNKMVLAMVSLSQRARRARDIIPLPGACVLGLAFLITFTCVVVLWGLMMEAAHSSKVPASSNGFGDPADLDKGATISFGKLPRFHVFESQPAAQQTKSAQPPPPRVCPALTLPAGVDQFRIPAHNLNRLRAGDLAVQILGLDDKPLLHAGFPLRAMENEKGHIGYDKVGRWLQLTTSATDKQPHVCIGPLPISNQSSSSPSRLQNVQVRGLHGAVAAGRVPIEIFGPTNARYGSLSRRADKWHVFYSAGQGPEQLLLSMHTAMPFPGFSAYSKDGKEIAIANLHCRGKEFSSADMLTITVKPGFDHMLVLVTMLAVVLSMFEQVPSKKGTDAAGDSSTSQSLPHATTQSLPIATSHSLPPGFQPDT